LTTLQLHPTAPISPKNALYKIGNILNGISPKIPLFRIFSTVF
jgi:hypothetical protein